VEKYNKEIVKYFEVNKTVFVAVVVLFVNKVLLGATP